MANNKINEQLAENAHKTVNVAYDLIQSSIDGMEQILKLNFEASKKLLENNSQILKDIAISNSPTELMDNVNRLALQTIETNIGRCKSTYEIVTEMHTRLGNTIEEHMHEAQDSMAKSFDSIKSINTVNPLFSNNNFFKNWMSGATQAFNTLTKIADQMSAFADKSMKSSSAATSSTKSTTATKSK